MAAQPAQVVIDVWYSEDGLPMINHLIMKLANSIPAVQMVQHCISEVAAKEAGDDGYDGVVVGNGVIGKLPTNTSPNSTHLLIFTPMVDQYLLDNDSILFKPNLFPYESSILMLWGGDLSTLGDCAAGKSLTQWHKVDPHDPNDFIAKIMKIATKSRSGKSKGGFALYPATIFCNPGGEIPDILIVIDDELLSRVQQRDLTACVTSRADKWEFPLELVREGVYYFQPALPECVFEEVTYMVHVKLSDGSLGSRRLGFLPQLGTLNPMNFITDAFLLQHNPEAVDKKLASLFNRSLPFEDMPALFREDPTSACTVDKVTPTLLHFCAHFNMKELANLLLTLPGSCQSLDMYNCQSQTPIDIAITRGHKELANLLGSFQTYNNNCTALRDVLSTEGGYVSMNQRRDQERYVQPSPRNRAQPATDTPPEDMYIDPNPPVPAKDDLTDYMIMDKYKSTKSAPQKQAAFQRRSNSERAPEKPKRLSQSGRRSNTLPEEDTSIDHEEVMGADLVFSPDQPIDLSRDGRDLMQSVKDGEITTDEAVRVFKFLESKAEYFSHSSLTQKQEILTEMNAAYEAGVGQKVKRRPGQTDKKTSKTLRDDRMKLAKEAMSIDAGENRPNSKDSSYESDIDNIPEEPAPLPPLRTRDDDDTPHSSVEGPPPAIPPREGASGRQQFPFSVTTPAPPRAGPVVSPRSQPPPLPGLLSDELNKKLTIRRQL